jgi:type IV secretory pathway VirB9-like protein
MVTWLRFPSAADMNAALAATPTDKTSSYALSAVCVSQSRAEVVMFDDVGRGRIDGLCAARDGRIVHRERQ